MKKILHVIHGLNRGGAEMFIFNLLSAIDDSQYRFDFAIQEHVINYTEFKKLIEKKGGKIFIIPDFMHNPIGQAIELKKILQQSYDVIHIHINAFINPIPAIVASKFDCKTLIHSHSTKNGKGGLMGRLLHQINKSLFLKNNYIRLACSDLAGKWMFEKKSYTIIPNGVDPIKYKYDETIRNEIREKYNIGDAFVIGQVGRLIELKNQSFSIKLLAKLRERYPQLNAKLILIGDGPMKEDLLSLATKQNVKDHVIFTGVIDNVNEYYSAFDIFVMPSYFEGLAFAGVEAQASGLKSFIANNVTRELNITDSVTFLPISDLEQWIEAITCNIDYDRHKIASLFIKSPFNSTVLAQKMSTIYN